MQAMRVRRLSDPDSSARYYLDGRRVSRGAWDLAHYGKHLDTFQSRIQTRHDGSEIVREYHQIVARRDRS